MCRPVPARRAETDSRPQGWGLRARAQRPTFSKPRGKAHDPPRPIRVRIPCVARATTRQCQSARSESPTGRRLDQCAEGGKDGVPCPKRDAVPVSGSPLFRKLVHLALFAVQPRLGSCAASPPSWGRWKRAAQSSASTVPPASVLLAALDFPPARVTSRRKGIPPPAPTGAGGGIARDRQASRARSRDDFAAPTRPVLQDTDHRGRRPGWSSLARCVVETGAKRQLPAAAGPRRSQPITPSRRHDEVPSVLGPIAMLPVGRRWVEEEDRRLWD